VPTNKLYQCVPCNYEYEYLDFGLPARHQKPVPPCPICKAELTYEVPLNLEDYNYQCWQSEGGCGRVFSVEHLTGAAPETYGCPICGATAKLKLSFAIVHGKSMNKGASIDVAIGRDADSRWQKVIERKSVRDKIRKETGTQALTATGRDEYQPLSKGRLEAVTVPDSTVNKDE
jgi:hypothetical protein